MKTCSSFNGFEAFGCWVGYLSAIFYFLVQIPQIILNYQRKSTVGFSISFVILRIIGISFFTVNSIVEKSQLSLIVSGFLILFSFCVLLCQYCYYEKKYWFYLFNLVVLVPILMSTVFPETIHFTNFANALMQIICCIPLIIECIKQNTTKGISLFGQHINFLGSIFGIFMCTSTCVCHTLGWLLHLISMLQSVILYAIAINFDEMRLFDIIKPFSLQTKGNEDDLDQILNGGEEFPTI